MKEIYDEDRNAAAISIFAAVSSVAAMCFLTTGAGAAFAQGGSTRPTSVERRIERQNRQGEQYDLEKSIRDMKRLPEKPTDGRRAKEAAQQIKHDFEGLQESYNQIVLVMAEKEGLNRKHDSVFRAVAEINKYSTRLKTNLALPRPKDEKDEKARVEANNEQIEESLMTLRKHIYNFVTNPLFESLGLLDLEQGRKAGRDLDRIIEVSESIRRSGDKIKNPSKP